MADLRPSSDGNNQSTGQQDAHRCATDCCPEIRARHELERVGETEQRSQRRRASTRKAQQAPLQESVFKIRWSAHASRTPTGVLLIAGPEIRARHDLTGRGDRAVGRCGAAWGAAWEGRRGT
jgi:hypothetical protein